MKQTCPLRPGDVAPGSAIFDVVGPRGGIRGQVTVVKGNRMPPTDIPNCQFQPATAPRNGSGEEARRNRCN